jgi:hypothetical protein
MCSRACITTICLWPLCRIWSLHKLQVQHGCLSAATWTLWQSLSRLILARRKGLNSLGHTSCPTRDVDQRQAESLRWHEATDATSCWWLRRIVVGRWHNRHLLHLSTHNNLFLVLCLYVFIVRVREAWARTSTLTRGHDSQPASSASCHLQ